MDKGEFRVLVAEDDDIVRDVIVKFLTEEGYASVVAKDGLSALDILRVEDVRLVLTDLRMPGADGMEVLRTALRINPKTAVVLLTAYGTLDTALEAMKEGAYDYIVKPFVMQQLLLVVRNAYRMASLMEENEKLSGLVRDMYQSRRKAENSEGQSESAPSDSGTRIDKLKELNVISDEEAELLKGRLSPGIGNDRIRQYNSLINNLKSS